MELYSSHQRLPATLLSAALLTLAFFTYARLTGPLLRVEPARRMSIRTSSAPSQPTRSPDFQTLAEQWFPGDEWVRSAGKRFRDQQRYLFFNTFELLNENHSMIVSPIAMLWLGTDNKPPVTITAASAQLDRSSAFRLEEGEFGRITSGSLFGDVELKGPDGLRIRGRNFHVSEKDMKMWSNQPVDFAFETHTGRAESGVEIKLLGSASQESGLVSVSDIQSITMLGRVVCDLQLPQGENEPDVPVRINAANGFEYFVPTRTARFSGFPDRELTPRQQIVVQQATDSGELNQLFCSQLTLYFQPRVDDTGTDERRLDVQRIDAEGSRVVFYSPENELTAWMSNLRYHVAQRTMQLWNRSTDDTGAPLPVRVQQRETELRATRIDAIQDYHGEIRIVECRGPGILTRQAVQPEKTLFARWNELMRYVSDQTPVVTLSGSAVVSQPGLDLLLGGQRIEMLLKPGEPGPATTSPVTDSLPSIDLSAMQPERLTAFDGVQLKTREMEGTIRHQLTVDFGTLPVSGIPSEAASPGETTGLFSGVSAVNSAGGMRDGDEGQGAVGRTTFSADTLEAAVLMSPHGIRAQHQLSDLWLKGGVIVEHSADDTTRNFRAAGNVVYAAAGLVGRREIQLFGDPATMVSSDRRIEGQRIDLYEERREARVEGSGRIRLVVDRGLDGRPLPKPAPLDIFWSRQMVYSGRTARFIGDIRAVMKDGDTHHLELQCDGMRVQFVHDMSAGLDRKNATVSLPPADTPVNSEIESIHCESLVKVHVDELVSGIVEAMHRAEFSDFHINLQSGDFHGQGPGWIESTQPDRDNQLRVAPEVTARANTPVRTPESTFVFVRASFIGTLSGNLNDQVARLENHVAGVFGPVRRPGDRLILDAIDTSRLPEQAGVLRCEEMTISVIPGPLPDQNSFSLTAATNARLESRRFSGDADRITYDHAKQQFILRSEGDTLATVYHRPAQTDDVRSLAGKRFEYYPGRNQLTASQITGVQAAE